MNRVCLNMRLVDNILLITLWTAIPYVFHWGHACNYNVNVVDSKAPSHGWRFPIPQLPPKMGVDVKSRRLIFKHLITRTALGNVRNIIQYNLGTCNHQWTLNLSKFEYLFSKTISRIDNSPCVCFSCKAVEFWSLVPPDILITENREYFKFQLLLPI